MRWVITAALLLALDAYAFQALKTATRQAAWARYLYWGLSLLALLLLVVVILTFDRQKGMTALFMLFSGLFVSLLVPKLVLIVFMLSEDLLRVLVAFAGKLSGREAPFLPARRQMVSQLALAAAAIPLAGVIHGIWKGRYRYRVMRHTLYFEDLPPAFDGFTITQISDLHVGSFTDVEPIKAGIELVKSQQSDLLVFTGDMVNNRAEELEPWREVLGRFEAREGAFAVLGNHDYGDYSEWLHPEAKAKNLQHLVAQEEDMGFRLLRNAHQYLEREGQRLYLAGVENWGLGFHQYGDLDAALQGVPAGAFTILLSHDPTHYELKVKEHPHKVALTLSGHTHGMQFGIEIPGWLKWSPVQWRYPKWAGLYLENERYLHINRGFGYLAFPGRVGIWPEVTHLTLRRGSQPT